MPTKTTLKIGDRVKLTELGRKRFPKYPDRQGTVVAIALTQTKGRVRWEGRTTADYVHASFVELCEE